MSRTQQVRRVLLITLFLNVLVAFGKILLGAFSGSLAVLADGFHSLTDGAGNVAGLVATSIAARPPDEDHPYGHRRFETLAALLVGGLLLLTAWEMLQGVLERLQTQMIPEINALLFAVLGATLLMNIGVSTYQIRAGRRLQSEILLADARNTRADVYVTLSVIGSTALVSLTGLAWIDAAAALVVIALIAHAAWQIVRQTGSVLVDTAPFTSQQVRDALAAGAALPEILRVRSRGTADDAHIDLDLLVPPAMTADHSESLARKIEQQLREAFPGVSEVKVQFLAQNADADDPILVARALADGLGLSTHEVHLLQEGGSGLLELHVEVPAGQTLHDAHAQVSALERELVRALPSVGRVVTHIEPRQPQAAAESSATSQSQAERICKRARAYLQAAYPHVGWHHFATHATPHGFALNLHAALPPQISLEAAHELAESAEVSLRGAMPELARITIHTEPDEQSKPQD